MPQKRFSSPVVGNLWESSPALPCLIAQKLILEVVDLHRLSVAEIHML